MYEAEKFLLQWSAWLLLIIPAGAGAMVTYQYLRKTLTDDEGTISDCNNKIRNTVKGGIIAISISGIVEAFKLFYM